LPISQTNLSPSVSDWPLPGRLLVLGARQTVQDGATTWETHVVTLALDDGAKQVWNLQRDKAVP